MGLEDEFPFGAFRPIFRGELAVSFREGRECLYIVLVEAFLRSIFLAAKCFRQVKTKKSRRPLEPSQIVATQQHQEQELQKHIPWTTRLLK